MAQKYLDASSSSDGEFNDENSEDLSHSELEFIPEYLSHEPLNWKSLQISHNSFTVFPEEIGTFLNLINIDISNNGLTELSECLLRLKSLQTLTARNNLLDTSSLPKDFGTLTSLETVNFSGNKFVDFPVQLTELTSLKNLYIGANQIESLPNSLGNLRQ